MEPIQNTELSYNDMLPLARKTLNELLPRDLLDSVVPSGFRLVVVGGVVRDILLSIGNSVFFKDENPWPDIDVAFVPPGAILNSNNIMSDIADTLCTQGLQVTLNSFNGLKINDMKGSKLDAWIWPDAHHELGDDNSANTCWLEQVDFGINAIAAVWPGCRIIRHPQWDRDVNQAQIEMLCQSSPRREIQSLRAIALSIKLNNCFQGRRRSSALKLGRAISKDLRWLVTQASQSYTDAAFSYLLSKLESKRWPIRVAFHFLEKADRFNPAIRSKAFNSSRKFFELALLKR